MTDTGADVPSSAPPDRRRIFLFALFPVGLILLLTGGMRLVAETARQRDLADDQAANSPQPRVRSPRIPPSHPPTPLAPTVAADKATQAAVEAAVNGQVRALGTHDYAGALRFSVQSFRASVSPAAFGQLIEHGYNPMTVTRHITFLPAQVRGGAAAGTALIVARLGLTTGEMAQYGYVLMHESDGWKVASVQPIGASIDEGEGGGRASVQAPMPGRL